jgi:type VI secretion system secreted protein VgrG
MREGFTQKNAVMRVSTPFGDDALMLDTFHGVEAISQPFKFSLSMRGADATLDPAIIIGAITTVTLQVPKGPMRYFSGIVSRFLYAGGDNAFSVYTAEMVPALWLLTLSRDRKIYQNKTAAEILKEVLGDFAVVFDDQLTGTYGSREYCVQYDETAFDFIARLMEEEGIFYFFTFAEGAHTMVLADAAKAHVACTKAADLKYFPDQDGRRRMDVVNQLEFENRLVTQKFEYSDFNYLTPTTALLAQVDGAKGKGKLFDYPGKHDVAADGTRRATVRSEASQQRSSACRGTSYCYPLTAGTKFNLTGHPRSSLNTALILQSVTHWASPAQYCNAFDAFEATVPYRTPRHTALPRVSGSQTALVVGPSGEEIWTDDHGRIKVQFHWDRLGANDDKSSCWVRVAQSWAGKGWGSLFLPRIGQEVVISFVDGDPDRPLVTGSVYNGENKPPVSLPAMQTQSTIRSRSSKEGAAGNEMRMEDKKDSEEFYFHAQKDMKIEIENDLSTTLHEGAEIHTLEKGDRTVDVQTGKEVHNVKGTRALAITGNETHSNKADFLQDVGGKYELKVTGDLLIDVTGTITIKSAQSISSKAGTTFANEAGTALTNKAGTELTNQAGTGLKNKAGTTLDNEGAMVNNKASASQTVDGGGMLTLKGGMVKIN